MTIKTFDTDRPYPDKKAETRVKIKIDGYSVMIVAKDFWDGPSAPEESGKWVRGIYVEN